jgi:hypothetical protein
MNRTGLFNRSFVLSLFSIFIKKETGEVFHSPCSRNP